MSRVKQHTPPMDEDDEMATVPIPARKVVTTFDAASKHERIENKPLHVQATRRAITKGFGLWVRFSTSVVKR